MLTSFFSKSTPINYLIIGALIVIGYLLINIFAVDPQFNLIDILRHLVFATLTIFIMLLLDFIIRKNNLTGKSTYGIFIFAGFLLMVPPILKNGTVMIAAMCCLFSMRRILSFSSEKNIEKKILDASLWIALASFFYFYSLLFLFVLYYAILRSPNASFRYLFIPPIGLVAVFIMATAFHYVIYDSFGWINDYLGVTSMDFSAYNSFSLLIPSALFLALAIWITMYRIVRLSKIKRKDRPNYFILLLMIITGIVVAIASPVKNGSELLFMLPFLAIAATDYIENREEPYIKEVFLWIIALVPIALIFV